MKRCTIPLLSLISVSLYAQNIRGTSVSALPDLPFTGQQTIVWTHLVGDKPVTTHLAGTVARDARGRVYREGHRFTVDAVDPRTTLTSITIQDPAAGIITDCDISMHFCKIINFPAKTVAETAPVTGQTTEELGSQVHDGFKVIGTRITRAPMPSALDHSSGRGQK